MTRPAPFDCGCGCCGRWSASYRDLAPRLARGALRLVEQMLYDLNLVAAGRTAPKSTLPKEVDGNQ